ncbi:hypothetical protein CAJCM15448_33110 [Candidozyma auris]|nr:hypothetical protein CAJCM15448_33110 [[Candida] auris]
MQFSKIAAAAVVAVSVQAANDSSSSSGSGAAAAPLGAGAVGAGLAAVGAAALLFLQVFQSFCERNIGDNFKFQLKKYETSDLDAIF